MSKNLKISEVVAYGTREDLLDIIARWRKQTKDIFAAQREGKKNE